jgi:AraC-like DNA-binding protein
MMDTVFMPLSYTRRAALSCIIAGEMMTISAQSGAGRAPFAAALADPFFAEALFDQLPDVVFFVKDTAGRYVVVNMTLVARCGYRHKHDLLGKSPLDLFPAELGAGYARQDHQVIATGHAIHNQLELHFYPNRARGWCLTHKTPLTGQDGEIIGLAGISRDLHAPDQTNPAYARVAGALAHIQAHYAEPLTLRQLARIAGMSVAQLERYTQRILDLTPKQLIIQTRLEAATRLLECPGSVAAIAHACGYADQSAFCRQFRTATGLSPTAYRALLRPRPATVTGP